MKITRLDLIAYGPFTDKKLDFHSDNPGLHIIFGQNEAGKSSALRALQSLLFGFPEQTSDNFLHPYDQLLVGGTLESTNGLKFSFLRRKKRKADILDPEGNALDSAILIDFLHGVEPAIFKTIYGIDHETLVQGGQDILAQKGEVGQALFAAGAGISSLQNVIAALDSDSELLFKARGSKQEINRLLAEYKKQQKLIKEVSLSINDWKAHRKTLQTAKAELEHLEKELAEKDRHRRSLERLNQALPQLSLRKRRKQQLSLLGEVIILPEDFSEKRKTLEQEIQSVKQKHTGAHEQLKKLNEKQQGISVNNAILDNAEQIEELHQRLGEYRKALKDRSRLDGMRISNRKDAADLLKLIRPDLDLEQAETLRPFLGKRRTIQNLSVRYNSLEQNLNQAEKRIYELENKIRKTEDSLSKLPAEKDPQNLKQAIRQAHKAGDIDDFLKERIDAGEALRKACLAEIKRLGLWPGTLEKLSEAPFPLEERVRIYDNDIKQLGDLLQNIQIEKDNTEIELARISTEIKQIEYAGEVPTEDELQQVREKRDTGWYLLRRQWLEGEDVEAEAMTYNEQLPLADAYETYVAKSDTIADRLRREADRVHKFATLKSEIESFKKTLRGLTEKEKNIELKKKDLLCRWEKEWQPCSILPLSPKEMLAWLSGIDRLRLRLEEMLKIENEVQRKTEERRHLREILLNNLNRLNENKEFASEELSPLLIHCEEFLETVTGNNARREKLADKKTELARDIEDAKKEREKAIARLGHWKVQWKDAVKTLDKGSFLSPAEATDFLDNLKECFDKLKDADDFRKRIEGIDRDARDYGQSVNILVQRLAPEFIKLPIEQTVGELQASLNKARKNQTILDKISEDIETIEKEIQKAGLTLESLEKNMAELRSQAGCEKNEELDDAERRSSDFLSHKERIEEVEEILARLAQGLDIEALEAQAAEVDASELPGKIESLDRDIEQRLRPEINHLTEIIWEENRALQAMDGSAKAAEAKEAAEQILARIRRCAEQYLRFKVAARILQKERLSAG